MILMAVELVFVIFGGGRLVLGRFLLMCEVRKRGVLVCQQEGGVMVCFEILFWALALDPLADWPAMIMIKTGRFALEL